MSEWRPIETLPEFQRAIVGRYDDFGEGSDVRYLWRQSEGHWFNWNPPGGGPTREWTYAKLSEFFLGPPTHWRPLLEPPPLPSPPAPEGDR